MDNAPDPAVRPQVAGYVAEFPHEYWDWHADRDCPELAADLGTGVHSVLGVRDRVALTQYAPSALGLARAQIADRVAPCPHCAFGPVLSELPASGVPGGYHALVCNRVHENLHRPCLVCTALTAHAATGATYLGGWAAGHAALLGPGALPDALTLLLERMYLTWENTSDVPALGPVTPVQWVAAAQLYRTHTILGQALHAAAGLYEAAQASSC